MSIKEMEELLEATRQKLADQGRVVDARLLDKERMLEQAVIDAHLDAELVEDGPIDMPSVAPAVLELLTPPVKRFFRNGVEHTLTQEDYNEETCAFVEEQDTTDWKQELRDFINDKSKKYDMPRDKHGYVNLMAQLAENNEIDAFIERKILEEPDKPMSSNKWLHNARKQVELPYKPVMELRDLLAPHEGDKE